MDINDATRAGVSVADLMAAAAGTPAIAGADVGRATLAGKKELDDLVELVSQTEDTLERNRFIAHAAATPATRRAFAYAYTYDHPHWLGAAAAMASKRGSQGPVKALERAIKAEVASLKEARSAAGPTQGDILDRLLEPLGVKGLRAPDGWRVTKAGVSSESTVVMQMPVVVTERSQDADTGKLHFRLAWLDGDWRTMVVERGDLMAARRMTNLADWGLPFNSNNSAACVQYFEKFEAENSLDVIPSVGRMGWVGDKTFVVGERCIGERVVIAPLPGEAQRMAGYRAGGSWSGWCDTVKAHGESRPPVMVAIYASLAAPLLRMLKRKGFCVDFSGETSRGKSRALEGAASCWGVPSSEDGGIIGTWNAASTAGLFNRAWVCQSTPVLLDDTKEVRSPSVVSKALYCIPQGTDTTRSNRDGSSQVSKSWRTVMITTGEASITSFDRNHGAKARAIIIDDAPFGAPTVANKEAADAFGLGISQNYGHAGPRFVEYIMGLDADDIVADYDEIAKEMAIKAHELGADNLLQRLVGHAAVVALAARYLAEIGLDVDSSKHIEYLLRKAAGEGVPLDEHDMPKAALDSLFTWIAANELGFWQRSPVSIRPPQGGWLGRWDAGPEWDRIGVNPAHVKRVLEEHGHDFNSVKQAWKKRGWLHLAANGGNPNYGPSSSRLMVIKREAIDG